MDNVMQLIYSSAAVEAFTPAQLHTLLLSSRKNNEAKNISGILIYHDVSFLQVLEGEAQAVLNLFERIQQDPRHKNVQIILRNYKTEKEYGDWSMGFVDSAILNELSFINYIQGVNLLLINSTQAKQILTKFQEVLLERE